MKNKSKIDKKEGKSLGARKLSVAFIFILELILVFTFFDYIAHSQRADYAIPSNYFGNFILFGTVIGFFLYLYIRNLKTAKKSLVFSLTMVIILKIHYI